jgi:hydroxymethylpyrimidine pyrophosphatase-like HAD family hydrolase
MGNAEAPAVTEAAQRATASVDDDGVAIVLEEMLASAASVREFTGAQ